MPVLPGYENREELQVPNFAQVSPDTAVGSALSSLGSNVSALANTLSLDEKSTQAIAKANAQRQENISVENDLLTIQEKARDGLSEATSASSFGDQDGNGFYAGYAKTIDPDIEALSQKYANSPNYDAIMLKARKAVEPQLNAAAEQEFKLRRQFQGNVYDKKVADLSNTIAGVAAAGGNTDEAIASASQEWSDLVAKTTPEGKVRDAATKWGINSLQKSYAAGLAAAHPDQFNASFTQAMAWDNGSRTLNPAVAGIVTDARSVGADPRLMLATGELTNGVVTKSSAPSGDVLATMKQFEGFAPAAKWDYKQWTNGYGTRARYPGEQITQQEADRRFSAEVDKAHASVESFAPNADPGTKAALTDLTFNAGTKWQTQPLGQAVLRGDLATARRLFTLYDRAGGVELAQLKQRRQWGASLIGKDLGTNTPDNSTPFDANAAANFYVRRQDEMKANGQVPTPGNLYMAYNVGTDAADALLKADPNAKVSDVLSKTLANRGPGYVSNVLSNPMFAKDMTVGQALASFDQKVNGALQTVDDKTSSVTAADRTKKIMDNFFGPDNPHVSTLSPADLASIENDTLKTLNANAKKNDTALRFTAFSVGAAKPDPNNSEDRKAINDGVRDSGVDWNGAITGQTGADLNATHAKLIDDAKRFGMMPESVGNAYSTLITGKGPQENRLAAVQALATLSKQDPTTYANSKFPDEIKDRVNTYRALTDIDRMSPDRALAIVDFNNSDEGKKLRKEGSPIVEDSKERQWLNKTMTGDKIASLLGGGASGFNGVDQSTLNGTLQTAFRDHYDYFRANGKSQEDAQKSALLMMQDTWGPSATFGGAVVPYPIEKTYAGKQINGSFAWVKEQAVNAVGVHLLTTGQMKLVTPGTPAQSGRLTPKGVIPASGQKLPTLNEVPVSKDDVYLQPTIQTQDDVRAGRPATYDLWYRDSRGAVQKVGSFKPDYNQAWSDTVAKDAAAGPTKKLKSSFGPGFNTFSDAAL